MLGREYNYFIQVLDETMRQMLDTRDPFECISEELKPDNRLTRTRPDLENISFDEEHTSFPISS